MTHPAVIMNVIAVVLIYLGVLLSLGEACVNESCTVTCNASAVEPCCPGTGRCEWDPVFLDCEFWDVLDFQWCLRHEDVNVVSEDTAVATLTTMSFQIGASHHHH